MDDATPASPRVEKRFDPDKVLCGPEPEPWPVPTIEDEVFREVLLDFSSKCFLICEVFFGLTKLCGYFDILLAFRPEFLLSEGFAPGPPKKPPPWDILLGMLFIFFRLIASCYIKDYGFPFVFHIYYTWRFGLVCDKFYSC